MGLGKTIQALAAIGHCIADEEQYHHVVICPAHLVDNWLSEIAKVLPSVGAYPFRQPGREKALDDWCADGGILVTSYNQCGQLTQCALPSIGFVIADECHYAKNPTAQQSQNTAKLAELGQRALLMSGTILENRASEVISLATVVDPHAGAVLRAQFGDGSTAHLVSDKFRQALGKLYLRRNQDAVLVELPGTVATDELVEIGASELSAYREQLADDNMMQCRIAVTAGRGRDSAKMKRLKDIVEECRAADKKMLIFSFFRKVVDIVFDIVGDDAYILHGDVTVPQRKRRIAAFKSSDGFSAIVSQIGVGGQGLNLEAASVVVLMEPQFKPSTEEQAVARAHRMGQTRLVVVHRLIARDTVDERIVKLTDFKAELFDELVRRSTLSEAYDKSRDIEIDERALLDEERRRHRLLPSSAV